MSLMESIQMRPVKVHAFLAGATETVGGGLLAAGLATPLASAALTGVMTTAIRKVPSGADLPVAATEPSWRSRRSVVSTGLSGQGWSARWTGQVGPAVTRPSTPEGAGQGAKAPAAGPLAAGPLAAGS